MLAIDLLDSSFQYTKQLFFPIHKKFWLKLGFVSMLSSRGGGSNYNLNGVQDIADIGNIIQKYWKILLAGLGALILFSWFWNIVQNTFTFIVIDSILTKKVRIRDGFHKHWNKGVSLFLFNLVLGLLMLLAIALLALPIALPVIDNWGNFSWEILSIPYIIFAVIALLGLILLSVLINIIVYNFTIIEMYIENNKFWHSFKTTLKLIRSEKKEAFVYLLLRIGIGIATAIIVLLVMIPVAIPFVLIGGGIFLVFMAINAAVPSALVVLIILGVGLGFILFLLFLYAISVVTAPITGFFTFYAYQFMSALRKVQSGSTQTRL